MARDYAGKGYATQFATLQKSLYVTTFVCVLGGGFFLATAQLIERISLFFFPISDILARDYAGKGYATQFVTLQKSLYVTTFVCVLGGGFFLATALFIERISLFFFQISDILARDYAGKGYATQFVTLQKSLYITTFVCVLGGGFFLDTALFIECISLFFFQISDILARDYAGKGYATQFVTLQKSLYIATILLCPRRRVLPRHCAIYRTYLSIFLPDLRHFGARLCREGLRHSVCNATEVTVHNNLRLRPRRRVLSCHCAIYRTFLSIFLPDLRHFGARLCREGLRHSVCNATEVTVHNNLRLRPRRRVLSCHCAIYRTFLSIFLPDLRHFGARLCREGLRHSVCNAAEVAVHNDLRLCSGRRVLLRHRYL